MPWSLFSFFNLFINFNWRPTTLKYCGSFCLTLTCISHGCTCVPHSETPSHLLAHPIPLGCSSASALSALFHASNLDWWSISHMIIYMLQCYPRKSSYSHLLTQSPKICSLYLCLFCCKMEVLIIRIYRVHRAKCQAEWSTSWNQDFWEKYQ